MKRSSFAADCASCWTQAQTESVTAVPLHPPLIDHNTSREKRYLIEIVKKDTETREGAESGERWQTCGGANRETEKTSEGCDGNGYPGVLHHIIDASRHVFCSGYLLNGLHQNIHVIHTDTQKHKCEHVHHLIGLDPEVSSKTNSFNISKPNA
jgi:hypothetical protein